MGNFDVSPKNNLARHGEVTQDFDASAVNAYNDRCIKSKKSLLIIKQVLLLSFAEKKVVLTEAARPGTQEHLASTPTGRNTMMVNDLKNQ